MRTLFQWSTSPGFMLRFHAAATITWFFLIFPSIFWWSESIKWIVLMSGRCRR